MKIFTCKQVSTALGEKDYEKMTVSEGIGLRIHVALCAICGKYNRQVMLTQDMLRAYRRREDDDSAAPSNLLHGDCRAIVSPHRRPAP